MSDKDRAPTPEKRSEDGPAGKNPFSSLTLAATEGWGEAKSPFKRRARSAAESFAREPLLPPEAYHGRHVSTAGRAFLVLEDPQSCLLAKATSIFIMALILTSSAAYVIATTPGSTFVPDTCPSAKLSCHDTSIGEVCRCEPKEGRAFVVIEAISIYIFTAEYVARLLLVGQVSPREASIASGADERPRSLAAVLRQTRRYVLQMMNLIDLAAILPFWVDLATSSGGGGFGFLRIFRLARVFRIFKLGKYNEGMKLFKRTLQNSLPALSLLFFYVVMGIVVFGSLIYFFERGSYRILTCEEMLAFRSDLDCSGDPQRLVGEYFRSGVLPFEEEISPFMSIPLSFWWVITTITTVGYGDMFPTSVGGKLVASCTMILGILVLALPISVLGSTFSTEYEALRAEEKRRKAVRRLMSSAKIPATASKEEKAVKEDRANADGAEAQRPLPPPHGAAGVAELLQAKAALEGALRAINGALSEAGTGATAAGASADAKGDGGGAQRRDAAERSDPEERDGGLGGAGENAPPAASSL